MIRIASLAVVLALAGVVPRSATAQQAQTPLTLRLAIRVALAHSPQLDSARDRIIEAELTMRAARSPFAVKVQPAFSTEADAPGFVQQQAGVSVSKRLVTGTEVTAGLTTLRYTGLSERFTDAGYTVAISQPLSGSIWKATRAPLQDAQEGIEGSTRALRQRQQDLVVLVTEAYYQVRRHTRLVATTAQSIERATRLRDMLRARAQAGLATELDVMRAELALAHAAIAAAAQQEAQSNARDHLCVLLGRRAGEPLEVAEDREPVTARADDASDAVIAEALGRRIDLVDLRARVAMARRLDRAGVWDVLPPVNLNVSYTRRGLAGTAAPGWADLLGGWRAGLSSSYGIDRTSQMIGIERRRLSLRAAERELQLAEERVAIDVQAARRAVRRTEAAISMAESARSIAERAAQLAGLRHERGLATSVELLDAEAQRAASETALAGAEMDFALAVLQMDRVVGRIRPEAWR